ncbi:unnamed protein product [Calypogeia fissa]
MESTDLKSVKKCLEAGESRTFGPIRACIVNFEAPIKFPFKFLYAGCTRLEDGKMCARNRDGYNRCSHHDRTTHMYRFDIFLVDESFSLDGNPPLRVGIFQAAADLIGMSPEDFSAKAQYEQLVDVHRITARMEMVDVIIRVTEKGACVQSIKFPLDNPSPSRRKCIGTTSTRIEQETDGTPLGMTLAGRWVQRKRHKMRHIRKQFVDISRPKPDGNRAHRVPPAVISVLEIAMPELDPDFRCWKSMVDPAYGIALTKRLEAPVNGDFRLWAAVAEREMKVANPPLSPFQRRKLELNINALRIMDTPVPGPGRPTIDPAFKLLRKRFCQNAIYFIEGIGDTAYWTLEHFTSEASLGKLEETVYDSSDCETGHWDNPPRPFVQRPLVGYIPLPFFVGQSSSAALSPFFSDPEGSLPSSVKRKRQENVQFAQDLVELDALLGTNKDGLTNCSIQP